MGYISYISDCEITIGDSDCLFDEEMNEFVFGDKVLEAGMIYKYRDITGNHGKMAEYSWWDVYLRLLQEHGVRGWIEMKGEEAKHFKYILAEGVKHFIGENVWSYKGIK